jgi:hypothetical protein
LGCKQKLRCAVNDLLGIGPGGGGVIVFDGDERVKTSVLGHLNEATGATATSRRVIHGGGHGRYLPPNFVRRRRSTSRPSFRLPLRTVGGCSVMPPPLLADTLVVDGAR